MEVKPKTIGKSKHRYSFLSCLIGVAFLAAIFCSPMLLRRSNQNSSTTSVDTDYSGPNATPTHSVLTAAMPITVANGKVLRYSIDVDSSYPPPLPSEAFDRYTGSLNWILTSDLPDEGIPYLYVFQGIKIALLTFSGNYTLYQHASAPEANNYLVFFNFESLEIITQTIIDGKISGVVFIDGLIDVQIKDENTGHIFFHVEHGSVEQVGQPAFLLATVDPKRSDLYIDDQQVENGSNLQIALLEGNHNLRAECEGYIADIRDVLLEPGTALDLHIILEPNINLQWIEESRYPVEILTVDNGTGESKKPAKEGAVCLATFEKRSVYHYSRKKNITIIDNSTDKLNRSIGNVSNPSVVSERYLFYSTSEPFKEEADGVNQLVDLADPYLFTRSVDANSSVIVSVVGNSLTAVAIGIADGCIEAYRITDGSLAWTFALPSYSRDAIPVVQALGSFLFAAEEDQVYAFDYVTGRNVWSSSLGASVRSMTKRNMALFLRTDHGIAKIQR